MESRIARVETLLESFKELFVSSNGRQDKILERIEIQTTKTNGGLVDAKGDIKDLRRITSESVEAQLKFREDQLFDRTRLEKLESRIFKYAVTAVAFGTAALAIFWCVDHGVLKWTPAEYHSTAG